MKRKIDETTENEIINNTSDTSQISDSDIRTILIIPMRGCPVFPGLFTSIEVSEPLDLQTVRYADSAEGFGLLLLKKESKKSEKIANNFYRIGTFVKVKNKINTIFGSKSLYLETICRFKVLEITNNKGLLFAKVQFLEEDTLDALKDRAYLEALKQSIAKRDDHSYILQNLKVNASNIPEAIKLTDYLASTIIPKNEQQAFLETLNGETRIVKMLKFLQEELTVQKVQEEIQAFVSKKLDLRQKEFYLREEYKFIQQQLENMEDGSESDESAKNENSPKKAKRANLLQKLKALNLQGEAYDTVFAEYEKMQSIEPTNPEYSAINTYLETIASLPWNSFSKDKYDIEKAKEILEKDHYGIKEVKERILEFLAVRELKKDTKGSIICLYGPPGTGKTSIGQSIAKALGKKYYRFSVGGMRDEAEIKGHRRTYIGSIPGQIIKGLKVTKTKNPVFVIDEIDKITVSNQGDPCAALLEVLDPEQNTTFRDHYLDVPFDVSNVLFIATANTLETIPKALLDRMECIELNGYTSDEKLHIGKKYLVPKSRTKHGLKANDVKYSDEILKKIAEEYAREAGVRNFEKAIDKIHRKIALEIVESKATDKELQKPILINSTNLTKYLGQPIFAEDEIITADKPGMSVGLAWTSMGGDVLAIEAQHIPGKGDLQLTGQLGDVMKESANIALSYIKSISSEYGVNQQWYTQNNIHLHVPEGATPKDGPSAGITMATAIFSLITNTTMIPDTAMTGELSLMGKVMPIGGLKEKILAAKRNKVKTIIIPMFNKRDLDKLDDNIKEGLTFHLVKEMREVISLVFPEVKVNEQN